MNFKVLMMLLEGLKDDFIVKEYDLDELEVYITKSSGHILFTVMDESQEVVGSLKWEGSL